MGQVMSSHSDDMQRHAFNDDVTYSIMYNFFPTETQCVVYGPCLAVMSACQFSAPVP